MPDSYKRLLPAPMPPGSSQASLSDYSLQSENGRPVKKRSVSKAACNNCRLKKTRCDGNRPACTSCSRASIDCNYVTASSDETPFMALKREVESLRRSTEDLLELFHLLESAPDVITIDILRRIKSTGNPNEAANDPSDVLWAVKKVLEDEPLLPVKLSNRQLVTGLIPETQQTPEYELMMRCPTTYPMLVPIEAAFLNIADLIRPATFEAEKHPSCAAQGDTLSSSAVPVFLGTDGSDLGSFEPLVSMYTVIDDRLKDLDIQKWTAVPIANELAATLISLHLEVENPWCPLFDADLFLEDCLQGRTHFCSRLLVSALLSWACQCYASLQPEAAGFVSAFELEAEQLWSVEKFNNTLTAAAASQLLSNTSESRGRGEFSKQCREEGIQMGKRMGQCICLDLVGLSSRLVESCLPYLVGDILVRLQLLIVMDGSTRSLQSYRAEIEEPPLLPMPGEYLKTRGFAHGTRAQPPIQVGDTFTIICRLSLIAHDIIWTYFGKNGHVPADRATVDFAETAFQRLFDWAISLPVELSPGRRNRHSALALHLYYHCIVMQLFWPFLQQSGDKAIVVKQLTSGVVTVQGIHEASVNQLKRLILIYCIDLDKACLSALWNTALLYLANAMLCETHRSGNMRDPECRFYFALCVAGYENMCMALRNGFLSTPEANAVLNSIKAIGGRYDADTAARGTFMVDLELAMTNPTEAQVQTLANAFHEMATFREFTTGELR
ncbi:hypothetical protein GGS23DRAFT_602066 [Durotheca rogersii]|uniref:uncharacterized protein n=1 Tax=Durotheca rogersii TaxID=419775 RepID=UPI00221EBCD5|nr:uncharacterized protein GGS23DRAFT_602066 [Durotheca rogersii]KAI5868169.1 hypothetical protein GGS23DRAFT_602066 [Durotheca rogersii]